MASKREDTKKNKKEESVNAVIESDEQFAFIVGYTSGGAPYGITWEEWETIEKENQEKKSPLTNEDVLPFD